jgi:hypothetical protein
MQPVRKVGRQHDDVGAIGAVGGRRVDQIIGTPAARAATITCTQASSMGRIAALHARSDDASAPADVVQDQCRAASINAFGFGNRDLEPKAGSNGMTRAIHRAVRLC